ARFSCGSRRSLCSCLFCFRKPSRISWRTFWPAECEREMKRKGIIIGGVLAAIVLVAFYDFYWGSTVPNGQQPLVRLTGSNISSLKDAFNGSANSVRLVVMLSPTCTVCWQGASAIQKLLDEQRDP